MFEALVDLISENFFLPIYLVTFIVSIVQYRKYFDTELKYFPILLVYTLFNELLGVLIRTYPSFSLFSELKDSSFNQIIYNIYSIVFFIFFYNLFWKLIINSRYKRWIFIGSIAVSLSFVISCFFQNPRETDLFYAVSLGSWFLVFCISLYFHDLRLQRKKIIQKNNLVFWVSLALVMFYTIFPILFLIGYLNYDLWDNLKLRTILKILIILMHGIFITGLMLSKRRSFS